MVKLVEECKLGISVKEIQGVLKAVARRAVALGLKDPAPLVIYVYCKSPPKGLIEVSRGVLVGEGVVAIRGNVLPNLAYEELILGFISLSLLETFGTVDRKYAESFTKTHYLSIVREALWGAE